MSLFILVEDNISWVSWLTHFTQQICNDYNNVTSWCQVYILSVWNSTLLFVFILIIFTCNETQRNVTDSASLSSLTKTNICSAIVSREEAMSLWEKKDHFSLGSCVRNYSSSCAPCLWYSANCIFILLMQVVSVQDTWSFFQ